MILRVDRRSMNSRALAPRGVLALSVGGGVATVRDVVANRPVWEVGVLLGGGQQVAAQGLAIQSQNARCG